MGKSPEHGLTNGAGGAHGGDTRDQSFDFVLTPYETTIAALKTVHLEKMRRILNERDEKMAACTKQEAYNEQRK